MNETKTPLDLDAWRATARVVPDLRAVEASDIGVSFEDCARPVPGRVYAEDEGAAMFIEGPDATGIYQTIIGRDEPSGPLASVERALWGFYWGEHGGEIAECAACGEYQPKHTMVPDLYGGTALFCDAPCRDEYGPWTTNAKATRPEPTVEKLVPTVAPHWTNAKRAERLLALRERLRQRTWHSTGERIEAQEAQDVCDLINEVFGTHKR